MWLFHVSSHSFWVPVLFSPQKLLTVTRALGSVLPFPPGYLLLPLSQSEIVEIESPLAATPKKKHNQHPVLTSQLNFPLLTGLLLGHCSPAGVPSLATKGLAPGS